MAKFFNGGKPFVDDLTVVARSTCILFNECVHYDVLLTAHCHDFRPRVCVRASFPAAPALRTSRSPARATAILG
jgi:hypothetical protein